MGCGASASVGDGPLQWRESYPPTYVWRIPLPFWRWMEVCDPAAAQELLWALRVCRGTPVHVRTRVAAFVYPLDRLRAVYRELRPVLDVAVTGVPRRK